MRFTRGKFYQNPFSNTVYLCTDGESLYRNGVVVSAANSACVKVGEVMNLSESYIEVEPQNLTFVPVGPKPGEFEVGDTVRYAESGLFDNKRYLVISEDGELKRMQTDTYKVYGIIRKTEFVKITN